VEQKRVTTNGYAGRSPNGWPRDSWREVLPKRMAAVDWASKARAVGVEMPILVYRRRGGRKIPVEMATFQGTNPAEVLGRL